VTARITCNQFSGGAQRHNQRLGLVANDGQVTASLSSSYHAASGIYVIPSVSSIHHPSFIEDCEDDINIVGTVYFLL